MYSYSESMTSEKQAPGQGAEINPEEEMVLGQIADMGGHSKIAQRHFLSALEGFRMKGHREGEASCLYSLGLISYSLAFVPATDEMFVESKRFFLAESKRFFRKSLAINQELENRLGEAVIMQNLGYIAKACGDINEAKLLFQESLEINRELGDRMGEESCQSSLDNI